MCGFAGLVLPFLQSWLFLGLGMICLSQDVPLFARMEAWINGRFPTVGLSLKRMKKIISI